MVHPGRHALLHRGAQRLHRKLHPVRPRRRLSRGQGSHGADGGQGHRVRPHFRFSPHGPHQRRVRGTLPDRAPERTGRVRRDPRLLAAGCRGGVFRRPGDSVFLAPEPARHRRIQLQGPIHNEGGEHHGGRAARLGRDHRVSPGRSARSAAGPQKHAFRRGCAGLAAGERAARDPVRRAVHRLRPLHPGHERRGDARPGVSRDRPPQVHQPQAGRDRHFRVQPGPDFARVVPGRRPDPRFRPAAFLRQLDRRHRHAPVGSVPAPAVFPHLRRRGGRADARRRVQHGHHRVQRGAEPPQRGRRAGGLVSQGAPRIRHHVPPAQHDRGAADPDRDRQPRRCVHPRRGVRVRRHLELRHERPGDPDPALQDAPGTANGRSPSISASAASKFRRDSSW